MSDQLAQKFVLPFAPHSPGWKLTEFNEGCYGIFDVRVTSQYTDEQITQFGEEVEKSASEFCGCKVEFDGGMQAGDFFCGTVSILYYKKVK